MMELIKTNKRDPVVWLEFGTAILVSIASMMIHITFIMSAGALWRDEISSVNIAQLPSLAEMWTAIQFDSIPPLWLFVLSGWTTLGFGDSDIHLRILGGMIGISLIGLLWWNARKMEYKIPLVSLILLGLSPTFFIYGDSLRPYGFGVLLMIWMVYSIWEVLQKPVWQKIAVAGIATILAVNCVYYNWLILFSVSLGALAVIIRNRALKTAGAFILIGIATLFSLSVHLIRLPQIMVMSRIWKKGTNTELIISKFVEAVNSSGSLMIWVWCCLFIFTGIYFTHFIFTTVLQKRQKINDLMLFMGISTGVSVVSYFLFLKNLSYNMESWYFMTIMGFLAVSFDIAIYGAFKEKRNVRVLKSLIAGILAAWIFFSVWPQSQTRMTSVDIIADIIEKNADNKDLVIVNNTWPGITFARYYTGKTPWMTVPELNDKRFHRPDLLEQKMKESRPIQDVVNNIAMTLRSGNKIWLVGEFKYLKEGEVPGKLPLPPLEKSGWYSGPYHSVWTRQLSYFIQSNAKTVKKIQVPESNPINKQENPPLFLAEGWAEKMPGFRKI